MNYSDASARLAARAGLQARQPVFGCALETHLKAINRPIAAPLELCCAALVHTNGLAEEVRNDLRKLLIKRENILHEYYV